MAASSNILIVDDDPDIRRVLKILLGETYTVAEASSGTETVAYVKEHPELDLVLLDVMMPGMDGFQTCDAIRKDSNVPVLFLTAKSEDTDMILGLNIGGDDYITKPFNPVELIARVRSHLRRYMKLGGVEQKQTTLQVGGIALDDDSKQVTVDGEEVALTPLEYSILKFLMQSPGKVFSSAEIYRNVW